MATVTRARVAMTVLLSLVLAGCAADARPGAAGSGSPESPGSGGGDRSASATGSPTATREWRSVPFTPRFRCGADGATCRLTMDVMAPAAGGPFPLVVVLAGGPQPTGGQSYANAVGPPLATRGVVVMRASWRQAADYSGGWPASVRDVACAVGVARRVGPGYGADPGRVTLVGHSLGGWVAAVVGLTARPFAPARGECDRTAGSTRPDAVVTLGGAVDEVRNKGLGDGYLNAFFSGTQEQRPRAWAAADPFALAARAAGPDAVPFTLVRGGRDTVVTPSAAPALHRALRRSGYRSRLVDAPSADHNGLLVAPRAIEAIRAAAGPSPAQ